MKVFGLLVILFSFRAIAQEKFITRIHSLSLGLNPMETHLVKFQNARVGFLTSDNPALKLNANDLVEIELDDKQNIKSVQHIIDDEEIGSVNTPFVTEIEYRPTLLAGHPEVLDIMDSFRPHARPASNSYDRAHVWAYEAHSKHQLYSSKFFLFISDKYIRKNNHKWWFHVAPLVQYQASDKIEEKILDPAEANGPLSVNAWTARLLESNVTCKKIEYYSQYVLLASNEDCYIQKTNMYFRHPKDLQNFEADRIPRIDFYDWEIADAYRDGFDLIYKL